MAPLSKLKTLYISLSTYRASVTIKVGRTLIVSGQIRPKPQKEVGTMVENMEHLKARTWLSPAQAVAYTGLGRARLYAFLADGTIPSAKVGSTRHIRRQDLDAFLEQHITATINKGPAKKAGPNIQGNRS